MGNSVDLSNIKWNTWCKIRLDLLPVLPRLVVHLQVEHVVPAQLLHADLVDVVQVHDAVQETLGLGGGIAVVDQRPVLGCDSAMS